MQTLLQIFSSLRLKCNWNFLKRSKFNYSKRIGISPKILEMGIFPKNLELFQKYWNFLRYSKLKCSKKIGIFPKNLEFTCFDLFMYDSKCFGSSNFFGFHKGIEKMMMIIMMMMMMMINEVNTMTTRQNDLVVKKRKAKIV